MLGKLLVLRKLHVLADGWIEDAVEVVLVATPLLLEDFKDGGDVYILHIILNAEFKTVGGQLEFVIEYKSAREAGEAVELELPYHYILIMSIRTVDPQHPSCPVLSRRPVTSRPAITAAPVKYKRGGRTSNSS